MHTVILATLMDFSATPAFSLCYVPDKMLNLVLLHFAPYKKLAFLGTEYETNCLQMTSGTLDCFATCFFLFLPERAFARDPHGLTIRRLHTVPGEPLHDAQRV